MNIEYEARYLEVSVEPRYWEDAILNGEVDQVGSMPLRNGSEWECLIDLERGGVVHWPEGQIARLRYKICDSGLCWLQDAHGRRIARWKGVYVPSNHLCARKNETGDYLDLTIGADGSIAHWRNPGVDPDNWEPLPIMALSIENQARHLSLSVVPLDWCKTRVNAEPDVEGKVPGREGDAWVAMIDLDSGVLEHWEPGVSASVRYDIGERGLYWLLDEQGRKIARWSVPGVPGSLVDPCDLGSLAVDVDGEGFVSGWKKPTLDPSEWEPIQYALTFDQT